MFFQDNNSFGSSSIPEANSHASSWVPDKLEKVVEPKRLKVLKIHVTLPFFLPKRQRTSRIVPFQDKVTRTFKFYQIGGCHPLHPHCSQPALDIRHALVLFALLSFTKKNKPEQTVSFSINQLAHRYGNSNSGELSKELRDLLTDLTNTYFKISDPKKATVRFYRIIERLNVRHTFSRKSKPGCDNKSGINIWLDEIRFSNEFIRLFSNFANTTMIRFDVLKSLRSRLDQAIYIYIPSRAAFRNEHNPFPISVSKLLEQLGEKIPPERHRRKSKFNGLRNGKPSIIETLDGLEIVKGILRVRIGRNNPKGDWILYFWAEGIASNSRVSGPSKVNASKLREAYLKANRGSSKDFNELMKRLPKLDGCEEHLLGIAQININNTRKFLRMVKAIIRKGAFEMVLADLKVDLEGGKIPLINHDPTGILIHRLLEAVSTPPKIPRKTS